MFNESIHFPFSGFCKILICWHTASPCLSVNCVHHPAEAKMLLTGWWWWHLFRYFYSFKMNYESLFLWWLLTFCWHSETRSANIFLSSESEAFELQFTLLLSSIFSSKCFCFHQSLTSFFRNLKPMCFIIIASVLVTSFNLKPIKFHTNFSHILHQ